MPSYCPVSMLLLYLKTPTCAGFRYKKHYLNDLKVHKYKHFCLTFTLVSRASGFESRWVPVCKQEPLQILLSSFLLYLIHDSVFFFIMIPALKINIYGTWADSISYLVPTQFQESIFLPINSPKIPTQVQIIKIVTRKTLMKA